jgi:hypothetical protein
MTKPQRYGASAAPREDGIFCLYAEYEKVVAECERLRARLEIDPRHQYDGIYCRDETIRLQGEEIDRLRAIQAANVEIKMALHMKTLDLAEEKIALKAEVRALREDAVGPGVRVESYSIPESEIEIIRAKQRTGPDKWKAIHGGYCLTKSGEWEWEPMPSSRTDDFIERCRFDSAQEAIDAARGAK